MKLDRRQFIKAGIAGGLVLGLAGWITRGVLWGAPTRRAILNGRPCVFFSQHQVGTLRPMIPVVLEGALPQDAARRDPLVDQILLGMDANIAALPPAAKKEFAALLGLLGTLPGRLFVARVARPWNAATPESIRGFLDRWQGSSSLMLRSGADALCMLTAASWYGNPHSWDSIGYDGPPVLGHREVAP